MFKFYIQLTLIALLIKNIYGQLFTNPISSELSSDSYASTLEKYNNKGSIKCYCDRNTNVCDLLCPCDTSCNSSDLNTWNKTELIEQNIVKQDQNTEFQSLRFPNCTDIGKQNKHIYANQVNSLTCILIENLPNNGIFYNFKNELQGDEDVRDLDQKYLHDPYNNDEEEAQDYVGGNTYLILENTDKTKLIFPGKDGFGYCSNQQPVVYLKDIQSKCIQSLNIQSNDATYLDSLWTSLESELQEFIDNIQLVRQKGKSGDTISVNNEYKEGVVIKPTFDQTSCIISNLIKQITVKFILSESTEEIQSAEIYLEYQDITISDCNAGISNKNIFYPFISDIQFIRSNDNIDDTSQLKLSGAYGYINGLNTHIGKYFNDNNNEYILQEIKGYSIVVADDTGVCLDKDEYTYTDTNSQIKFNQDITFSCKKINSDDLITDYKIGNYFITPQEIDEPEEIEGEETLPKNGYTMFGRYGIASPSLPKDWIELQSITNYGTFNKKDEYNQIIIIIFYSEAGPIGNEQQYIVEAHKGYFQNDNITEQFTLSVQYIKLEYDDLMETIVDPESQINEWIKQIFGGVESQ